MEVNTTKLKLHFYSNGNPKRYMGFEIRYVIQSKENDDTGVYVWLLIVRYLPYIS